MTNPYQEHTDSRASVSLARSEMAVFAAASRLFAACIARGELNPKTEDRLMDECLRMAIELARRTDDRIRSDNEL